MAIQVGDIWFRDEPHWHKDMVVHGRIVHRILADYYNPIIRPGGQSTISDDVTVENILFHIQIEHFVSQVSKSEQMAVQFDKDRSGIARPKINPLGQKLYRLLSSPRITPPKMQPSEGFILFEAAIHDFELRQISFSGNPMHIIDQSGLREGDCLNAIITCIRDGSRRKNYVQAKEERKKDAQQIASGQRKLVKMLRKAHPILFGTFVELMYRPDRAHEVSLSENCTHLQLMNTMLDEDPSLPRTVGQYWTRSYSTESGFRIRLYLLFDGSTTPINSIDYRRIFEHWRTSSSHTGVEGGFTFNFCGVDALLEGIKLSAMKHLYLRLPPSSEHPHFGVSDLPRLKLPRYADDRLTSRFQ